MDAQRAAMNLFQVDLDTLWNHRL